MSILKSVLERPVKGQLNVVEGYETIQELIRCVNAVTAVLATSGIIAIAMPDLAMETIYTITPTAACTFNASGGVTGSRVTFVITTSGTSSYVLTWGTNFKTVGTLATGTVSGKVFTVSFICQDGTTWCEVARTAAM